MAKTQTSAAFERIAGTLADGVAYGHRGGTALRARPRYRYPLQPSQRENNERLKRANALFNDLDEAEADAWTRYGERHPRRDPLSGVLYAPPAKNLLVGLACKLLQIDPDASLPRLPPAGAFHADLTDVAVEAAAEGVLFTAPRASRPGALTELMAQPLRNVRCKPGRFYKSRGFAAFSEGGLAVLAPLPPGVYAVAIQSVEAASGRLAGFTPLGKLTVG